MRLEGLSFPEAVNRLLGRSITSTTTGPRPRPKASPEPYPTETPKGPEGMTRAAALALVVEAEAWLWTPEGSESLAYLMRSRALRGPSIRAARLGWTPGVRLATTDGRSYSARGIVIPWFVDGRLALVKIRQPEGDRPKYVEVFRDRPSIYPCRRIIRPGCILIIVEGELDALLLGQELAGLAAVVTLGGTGSTKPEPDIRAIMRVAPRWFIATDADASGDKAATRWEGTRAQRVRPPEPHNDWTDAARVGVGLRLWWADRLGVPFPPYSWPTLAGWRWGPAAADSEPGIIIDRPDSARRQVVLERLGDGPSDAA
jgi:hypothetical protein